MKPALRGRFRREIRTLLEEGHALLVIGLRSDTDFAQGFEHENLTIQLFRPRTIFSHLRDAVAGRAKRAKGPDVIHGVSVDAASSQKLLSIPYVGWLRPIHRIDLYRRHWRLTQEAVIEWKPDVVHTCDLDGLVGGAKAAEVLQVPHVHDCHELFLGRVPFTGLERFLLGLIEKRFMKKADLITISSQSIADEYTRRYQVEGVVYRNCAYVPPHVELRDLRKVIGVPADTRIALYQGGFAPERGLEEMVRSVSHYPDDTLLVLLGYGPLKEELRALAQAAGVADRVFILDAVPPDELLGYTASANLGIVPYKPTTLNNKLALGNKIFEYLAAGVPVAAADNPELRKVIEDSGCGRVFDPLVPASLGAAVSRLLEDISSVDYRRRAANYTARNSWKTEKNILIEAYQDVTHKLVKN